MYLFATTELSQLVKLPVLLEHFVEHKAQDSSIALWGFLCMHYAHGNVKDADHDKDMKLPFKSYDGCSSSNNIAYIPKDFGLITKPAYNESTVFNTYTEKILTSAFLSCIWQPPKSC